MTKQRGYFGIGIINGKSTINYGTLFRSANVFGADFLFLIGKRFKSQSSDTMCSHRHVPLFEYKDFQDFNDHRPYGCELVAVELDDRAKPLADFRHPQQAAYLLGAEDHGIPQDILKKCQHLVKLPGATSLNVATAGTIVLYDRITRG